MAVVAITIYRLARLAQGDVTLTFRLGSRLRIDNDYLTTRLYDPDTSQRILRNDIIRSDHTIVEHPTMT